MVYLGERIKELRTGRKLNQKQLAELVGVTNGTISSYESGARYPSYEVLINLSHIFHVSVDYLLGIERRKTIDVSGLKDEDIAVVVQLIDTLRKK